jgi:hypothetical protein
MGLLGLRASTLAVKTAPEVSGGQFEPNYIASASASGTIVMYPSVNDSTVAEFDANIDTLTR